MYRELAPPPDLAPQLAPVVEAVWVREPTASMPDAEPRVSRILPDACTDLIWVDGELVVAGPDTRAHLDSVAPGSAYVAVRFRPGAGPTVFGVPGDELRDGRIPLDALWPADRVRRLADRIFAAPDRPRELQLTLVERLAATGCPDRVAAAIARRQRTGHSVAATAAALGLSVRQLHRRSLAAFGYGPKTLGRVLRFRSAVASARGGTPFAEVAAGAGYADQAHLAREVRTLSGVPLRELIR